MTIAAARVFTFKVAGTSELRSVECVIGDRLASEAGASFDVTPGSHLIDQRDAQPPEARDERFGFASTDDTAWPDLRALVLQLFSRQGTLAA